MIDVESKDLNEIKQILQNHVPDSKVWAFGSRVNGTAKKFSDLDLAIMGTDALSLEKMGALKDAFSASNLLFTVDVVDWLSISESFQKIIKQQYAPIQEQS